MTEDKLEVEMLAQELSRYKKRDWTIEDYRKQAIRILAFLEETQNLVQLDPDQNLPPQLDIGDSTANEGICNLTCHNLERKLTIEAMLGANWRKILR